MTPQEEVVLVTFQKGKVHTLSQLIKVLNVPNISNYAHCMQNLVRNGILKKNTCPKCDKAGYYEVC